MTRGLRQAEKEGGESVEVVAGGAAGKLGRALSEGEAAGVGRNTVAGDFILHLVGILQVRFEASANVVASMLPVHADVIVPLGITVALRLKLVGGAERVETGDRKQRHSIFEPLPAGIQRIPCSSPGS